MLPIRKSDEHDGHARYKMPTMDITYTKTTTVIQNLDKVSKALHIDIKCIECFLKSHLHTKVDAKGIKGKFSYDVILCELYKFIDLYILCTNCNYPELKYVAKSHSLRCKCLACGHNVLVSLDDKVWKRVHITTPVARKEPKLEFVPTFDTGSSNSEIPTPVEEDDGIWSDTGPEAVEARRKNILGNEKYFS